jgi:hypothetical protein
MNIAGSLSLTSVFLMLMATALLFIAYHNIDIAWNMERNAIDQPVFGSPRTAIKIYSDGIRQLQIAFMLFVCGYVTLSLVIISTKQ